MTKSIYLHEIDKDVPVCEGWIPRVQIEKHIEVTGGSGQGKTTLTEHLFLGIMRQHPGGMLLIDPKGHSVEKWLSWVAEGRVRKQVWLVDTNGPVLRYNPLSVDKDPHKLSTTVAGLFEALALMQSDVSPGQHRQMRRYVIATLRALIECDLTLADAYDWLTDPGFRERHLRKYMTDKDIKPERAPEWLKEWLREPSGARLESTENFFAAFWDHDWLKGMYSGDGFSWRAVYDQQPLVLVNLAGLAGSLAYSQAVAAMFITGLLEHARHQQHPKRWYAVIDDATDFTPAHVGQVLRLGRAFEFYITLIHHENFAGGLQSAVRDGCRTKFIFGEWGQGREHMLLDGFSCAQEFDKRFVQHLSLYPSTPARKDPSALKAQIFSHEWYGAKEKADPPAGADPQSERPKPRRNSRGQ